MARKYTVEISNRFNALRDIEDDPDTNYGKFIDINNTVAGELLPKLKKSIAKAELCNHPVVSKAKKLNDTYHSYSIKLTMKKRKHINEAKEQLADHRYQ